MDETDVPPKRRTRRTNQQDDIQQVAMGEVMQINTANRGEEEVRIIRYAPTTRRPHSPRQSPWRAPPPPAVKAIVARAVLDQYLGESYAKWASNFALLTDEFLTQVVKSAPKETDQLREWTCFRFVDCCSCKVGDNYLWVQKHDSGWTVELCYPDNVDPDARVLTIENMPILCPDGRSAIQLAEACYPLAPAGLVWHPYW
jgi:hypothetical protein